MFKNNIVLVYFHTQNIEVHTHRVLDLLTHKNAAISPCAHQAPRDAQVTY